MIQSIATFVGRPAILLALAWASFANSAPAHAAMGDVLATYNFIVADFATSPTLPYMYATDMTHNSLAVIDTKTLLVTATVPLPGPAPGDGSPRNLAVAPDGNTIYVANYTNNTIDEIDAQSLSIIRSLPAQRAFDVAVGLSNRLYVADRSDRGRSQIAQIDATTGLAVGDPQIDSPTGFTSLQISPDQTTLYASTLDLSPLTIQKYNVATTATAQPIHSGTFNRGLPAVLNHSGTEIARASGAAGVTLLQTSSFAPLGNFNLQTATFASYLAFSPDDQTAYIGKYPNTNVIEVFSTTTLQRSAVFPIPNIVGPMLVDQTGRHLFASFAGDATTYSGTIVYDVSVPEPGAWLLALFGMLTLAVCRLRQIAKSS